MDHTICHFEIPVDDLDRAEKFYNSLFGWDIKAYGGPESQIRMVNTVPTDEKGMPIRPGINGMLIKKQNPQHPFANYVMVESVQEYGDKAVQLGGKIALPRTSVPGMGWFLYIMDTEGTILGLWETDSSAA